MQKDIRYKACEVMITTDKVKSFRNLFVIKCIPKSVLAKDLKISAMRFNKLVEDPSGWTFGEILAMGKLFNVDPAKVFALLVKDVQR